MKCPTAHDLGPDSRFRASVTLHPDANGVGTSTTFVRAERDGEGNGRVYHINFTAEDGYGGAGEALITVPINQSDATAVDDGALYDIANTISI
jgi:hypothetical protein